MGAPVNHPREEKGEPMKVNHSKEHFPRTFDGLPYADRILLNEDFRLHPKSRVWCKLIVLTDKTAMQRFLNVNGFWGAGRMGRDSIGACLRMYVTGERYIGEKTIRRLIVDPRYFSVIVLNANNISIESIAHESAHAAFNYAYRKQWKNVWGCRKDELEDEQVCYPVGRISEAVFDILNRNDLLPKSLTRRHEKAK